MSNKKDHDNTLISAVYMSQPRGEIFIRYCLNRGKRYMHQLSEDDFQNAQSQRGLGQSSVNKFRQAYDSFYAAKELKQTSLYQNTEEMTQPEEDDLSTLPLSLRAINSLPKADITTLKALVEIDYDKQRRLRIIGPKAIEDIRNFVNNMLKYVELKDDSFYLKSIDEFNMDIDISMLVHFGMSIDTVEILKKKGIIKVENLSQTALSSSEFMRIHPILEKLSISVVTHFANQVKLLKDSSKVCLQMRCEGATLKEIGDKIGVTRERARQIIARKGYELSGFADMVASSLFTTKKDVFRFTDILALFDDETVSQLFRMAVHHSEYARQFSFSDKFVRRELCTDEKLELFESFIVDFIGEGLNFHDNVELLEQQLQQRSLGFFDSEDVKNYLLSNGYYFYGQYVTKGKQPYSRICYDAIVKYYDFDIRLTSDRLNEDIDKLRVIMREDYNNFELPDANRAVTGALTRDTQRIILSGRGRYCPIEKVHYSLQLFDEIYNFIYENT